MSLAADLARRVRWIGRSSTLRLTLLLSLIFAAGMAVAVLAALYLGRAAVLDHVDASLSDLAIAVDAETGEASSVIILPVAALDELPAAFSRVAARGGGTVELDDDFQRSELWRVTVAADRSGDQIMIAVPLDDGEDALELLGGVLWGTAGVAVAIGLTIGLGLGLLAQRRLTNISDTLDRLAAGDLQARTGINRSTDDLDDLGRRLDVTAAGLERLVDQTRHLSASLAHDLRTPLARLRARLEKLPDGDERSDALEEAGRLSDIFDTIMRVARIEAGHGTQGFEKVALGDLADELADTFTPVVEDRGKHLNVEVLEPAVVFADKQMLIQGMANLIQNALVHGGTTVTLFARGAEIGVADDGEGVDADQFDEIVKPMVRLDRARVREGAGLGLALVRAVADRHGAELALSQHDPKGLRVAIRLKKL